MEHVCENCGHPDEELAFVRRVYLDVEKPDPAEGRQAVGDPELWCLSCRSQYPFDPVEDDTDDAAT